MMDYVLIVKVSGVDRETREKVNREIIQRFSHPNRTSAVMRFDSAVEAHLEDRQYLDDFRLEVRLWDNERMEPVLRTYLSPSQSVPFTSARQAEPAQLIEERLG